MPDSSRCGELQVWLRFVRANAHILRERPGMLFQQASNQPRGTQPARKGWQRWTDGMERRPWLRALDNTRESAFELMTLRASSAAVETCAYSPDGMRVVAGTRGSSRGEVTLVVWNAETGAELSAIDAGSVEACAYSPDGESIAAAGRYSVTIRDAASGAEIRRLTRHGGRSGLVRRFAEASARLAAASPAERNLMLAEEWASHRPARHREPPRLSGCRYSGDGRRIVAFVDEGREGEIIIWDVDAQTEEPAARIRSPISLCRCAFSPDGRRVAGGAADGSIRVWDVATGAPAATLAGHDGWVTDCAYSPDGRRIVSASYDATIKIWDTGRKRLLRTLEGHAEPVFSCTFSPDGRQVLSAAGDSLLKMWDADTGCEEVTFAGHSGAVRACSFSPDGERIVSGSADGTVRVWEIGSLAQTTRPAILSGPVSACAFMPGGGQVVVASEGVKILASAWSQFAAAMSSQEALSRGRGGLRSLYRNLFPSIRRRPGEVRLWSAETGEDLDALPWRSGAALACAASPDGTRVVAAGYREARVWRRLVPQLVDLLQGKITGGSSSYRPISAVAVWRKSKRPRWSLIQRAGRLVSCQLLPDGRHVLLQVSPQRLNADGAPISHSTLFRVDAGTCRVVDRQEYPWLVGSPVIAPNGQTMVARSSEHSVICRIDTGDRLAVLRRSSNPAVWCAYWPDGTIGSASPEGALTVWDCPSGRQLASLNVGTSPPFVVAPHGRHLIERDARGLRVLDIRTGAVISTFNGHRRPSAARFAYMPGGSRVVSTDDDGFLNVWEAETGRLKASFASGSAVHCLALGRDGGLLAFGDEVGRVHIQSLLGDTIEPPIVTVMRMWRPGRRSWVRRLTGAPSAGRWDARMTARCPLCGVAFEPPPVVLDAIDGIARGVSSSTGAPCLDLPLEAWREPRLESACPVCRGRLRFNPFLVDGAC
jgi:WD40 repeat protein